MAHLFQEIRKWKPVVSCKRPDLPRCRGDFADDGRDQVDDDNGRHDIGPRVAFRDVVKELDERGPGGTVQQRLWVGDGEAEGYDDDVSQNRIQTDTPHHRSRQSVGSIFDFLRC